MVRRYDYKFERLGEGFLNAKATALAAYQSVIQEHAEDGWRLVQVFAPGMGGFGAAKYIELIFERPVA